MRWSTIALIALKLSIKFRSNGMRFVTNFTEKVVQVLKKDESVIKVFGFHSA